MTKPSFHAVLLVLIAVFVAFGFVVVSPVAAQAPAQSSLAAALTPPPDVKKPPADAQKSASGLYSKVITPGTGTEHPGPADRVTVNYTGWQTDGKMFDSTVVRQRPSSFPLNRVIPGWTEGVQLMVVGEKRRMWVPESLAYKGAENKPKGMLVFDVELLNITPAPPAPPDVAKAPADAKKTSSGLSWKEIKPGTGSAHPTKDSTVTVHYSGWTTDGKLFDSSVVSGQPASFQLSSVIPGWTEGVQLMVEGETCRFWIPERLAYQGQDGKPKGTLVFDVQLISIK